MSVIKRLIEQKDSNLKRSMSRDSAIPLHPVKDHTPLSFVKGKSPLVRFKMAMKGLMRFDVQLLDAYWHREATTEEQQKEYERRLKDGRLNRWITASSDAYRRMKEGQSFTLTFGIIKGRHTKTGRYLERCKEYSELLVEVLPKYGFEVRLARGTGDGRLIVKPMILGT